MDAKRARVVLGEEFTRNLLECCETMCGDLDEVSQALRYINCDKATARRLRRAVTVLTRDAAQVACSLGVPSRDEE